MTVDLFRDTAVGQIIRYSSSNRWLKYPEELPGFVPPQCYCNKNHVLEKHSIEGLDVASTPTDQATAVEEEEGSEIGFRGLTEQKTIDDEDGVRRSSGTIAIYRTKTREETLPFSAERFEIEGAALETRTASLPVLPVVTNTGEILVDWYTTDDPANPQNWAPKKNIYTFAVYSGSAIYTPSEGGVMIAFGVSAPVSSLGLALYVLGYGCGPLLFSPLSEVPRFGRNSTYVATYAIFVILCIPTALVNNIGGLLFLRFLQGFFGSPCLATGPATMQDIFSLIKFPYILAVWTSFSYCGPAVGPVLSGFAVDVINWRWSIWEMLLISGPIFMLMFLLMPETSADNILYRRAERLRSLTGNQRLRTGSEIKQGQIPFYSVLTDALIKPIQISILDPAVLFVNVYTSFVYATYYSFFEAFPIVYSDIYHFNLGLVSTAFLCILVACILGVSTYMAYLWFYLEPRIRKYGLSIQESWLRPALIAVFMPTVGLFLFAWTSRADIHWIVSIIGITIYGFGVFIILQCIFVYIPMSYPQYAASLFAGNDFCRSALACGAIMFARPLYLNLGIGRGVTVLAGCSTLGIGGMFFLYFYGARLRVKSKFTIKE
ncbi:MFS general substrate transporter [Aureobasidium subglaciale]|nr:MFS general substrate transporter [Aureobasidium subglaciale]KAI5214445.1 MFS general substrate transporter [Aureobasidium subglaciale]KAI5216986.1 MFS general substrate transporter [Aureobasidium subglaciale]KAI5254726.1 MFS general substrate transporter [Aureobasidium subglaciale]